MNAFEDSSAVTETLIHAFGDVRPLAPARFKCQSSRIDRHYEPTQSSHLFPPWEDAKGCQITEMSISEALNSVVHLEIRLSILSRADWLTTNMV